MEESLNNNGLNSENEEGNSEFQQTISKFEIRKANARLSFYLKQRFAGIFVLIDRYEHCVLSVNRRRQLTTIRYYQHLPYFKTKGMEEVSFDYISHKRTFAFLPFTACFQLFIKPLGPKLRPNVNKHRCY